MMKCYDCGEVFPDDEVVIEEWYESRGEFWGMPCSERMVEWRCPFCNSDEVDEYEEEKDA